MSTTTINTIEIAESICSGNQKLVEWINENPDNNYKEVRQQVNAITSKLSAKFYDGKFVPAKDLHALTWDIINVATGNVTDNDLAISI